MSAKDAEEMMFCASCGTAGSDDIKLKKCTACHLVKYCSVKCQKDHRSQHKKECKKRAAELHDEILFKQPESTHLGDCPISCVPLPLDIEKSAMNSCCSKIICTGCSYANQRREVEGRLQQRCPFCRKSLPSTKEEFNEELMKRIDANDPIAMSHFGTDRFIEGEYEAAFEYFTREQPYWGMLMRIMNCHVYGNGQGVEKDERKELHHLKEAAIGGHPLARRNLGCLEDENGHCDRAVKHWIIAAKLGDDGSLEVSVLSQLFVATRMPLRQQKVLRGKEPQHLRSGPQSIVCSRAV